MSLVVDLRKMLEIEMGVHLRAANAGMAEKLLDRTQIATRLQQVAGKTVPQHVRMDMDAEADQASTVGKPAADAR